MKLRKTSFVGMNADDRGFLLLDGENYKSLKKFLQIFDKKEGGFRLNVEYMYYTIILLKC